MNSKSSPSPSHRWSMLGAPSPFDEPCKWVTSPFFKPLYLALIRLLFALYTLTTIIVILVHQSTTNQAKSFFSYFTYLCYIGMCAYFWASATQTFAFALHPNISTYPLRQHHKLLQAFHVILWTTVTSFAPLVTIVYWGLLANASVFDSHFTAWQELSVHALNTVFASFEVFFTCCEPQPMSHIIFLTLILGGYLGVAYITRETQGFYTYSFLNPHKQGPRLAIYIIGIPLAAAICFMVVRWICKVRTNQFPDAFQSKYVDKTSTGSTSTV